MRFRVREILILALLALSASPAVALPTIRLTASRLAVLSDGRDSTEIDAEVRDSTGSLVPDGTPVTFNTTLGQFLEGAVATTRGGTARARLSSAQKGAATVMATTGGALSGGFQTISILFSDDPEDTVPGNTFIAVQCAGTVMYSAVDRVVDALGRPRPPDDDNSIPGAHLTYRNMEVFADHIQLDCSMNAVRASGHVHLRRGSHRVTAGTLFYPLTAGDGYAVAEMDRRLRPVKITGSELKMTPAEHGISPKMLQMVDLSGANLIITARQVLVFPGEKLQFKRPQFYQDGQKLMSMPFYSVGLFSNQLFTDQFMSVGSQGFSVDMPLYYDLTPGSMGIFSIRHGQQLGANVGAVQPGWSLDLLQSYNSLGVANRYTGQVGITGMTRSDWGVRWNHSQQFAPDTRATFLLDFPQHRSVYGSGNLQRQFGEFLMGLNLNANTSFSGPVSEGNSADTYLETMPKKVGKTGYTYSLAATAAYNNLKLLNTVTRTSSEGIQARFNSASFRLDKDTTLTNYFSLGNAWAVGQPSGITALGSLAATRTFKHASVQLSYDYTRQPTLLTDGNHRFSANLMAHGSSKWNLMLYASAYVDSNASSLVADFNYAFLPRWRWISTATLQRFTIGSYRDIQFGIGRTVGGREVVIEYSTFSHRIFFDMQAGRF